MFTSNPTNRCCRAASTCRLPKHSNPCATKYTIIHKKSGKYSKTNTFKKYFGTLSEEDKLKNPPKGYPKDFEEIDLLKNKHFVTGYPVPNDFFMQEHLIERIMEVFKAQYPLNAFINRALDK
jgi:Uncharacterized conserved protein